MKFQVSALVSALAVSSSSAFAPISNTRHSSVSSTSSSTLLNYSVGIVGATGAVGKEIRQCLENRDKLKVDELRIFGSPRSAGTTVSTKYGDVEVELFSVDAARQCDVVFLAVDGDFSLEHAHNICEGDDGAVVIDNSVRILLAHYGHIGMLAYWHFVLCDGGRNNRVSLHFLHLYACSPHSGTNQKFPWWFLKSMARKRKKVN